MEVVPCKCLSINNSSWLCMHVEHKIREINLVQHAIFVHSTHTDLCIVSFVYEINKGWERVPIKLVVHFNYLILFVYSACLLTQESGETSRERETLSYQANTSEIGEGRLSLVWDQAAARVYSRSEKLPRDNYHPQLHHHNCVVRMITIVIISSVSLFCTRRPRPHAAVDIILLSLAYIQST